MFARLIFRRNFLPFENIYCRVLLSSVSKNYICDSSIIESYRTNEKLKAIIDQQEHKFYYYVDKNLQQQLPPSVFKQISSNSNLPENAQYLTNATSENQNDKSSNTISLHEFLQVTHWNDRTKSTFPGRINLEILSIRYGYVLSQIIVHHELMSVDGYLHGGAIVTLADATCGFGGLVSLPLGATTLTTIELKTNFLGKGKPSAVLNCEAKLLHGGKTTQIWDAQVIDLKTKKLIAIFRCTQLIIYPESSEKKIKS
ncbi:unnamed protein product [Rotaria sp. Silwood1]|nr:unnamed protein product [Rotaria sp. Silwood1]CAF3536396.1 unnamed protein product [Rotaria sp. Silwood1]CAF4733631.1 unnamed protein product [Rotaria sp. Silwood1]CAF4752896.1 unnamed protein product [Rotaria sp. Silwood1]